MIKKKGRGVKKHVVISPVMIFFFRDHRGRSRKDQSRSLGPERIAEREPRPVKLRVSCSGDKIRERKDLED